jgi:hypothetical protein
LRPTRPAGRTTNKKSFEASPKGLISDIQKTALILLTRVSPQSGSDIEVNVDYNRHFLLVRKSQNLEETLIDKNT